MMLYSMQIYKKYVRPATFEAKELFTYDKYANFSSI